MILPVTESSLLPSLIHAVERADTPESLIAAVQALSAAGQEEGIPTLIQVLGYNNPGAAVIAVRGLVQMGEAAVLPLLNLDDYNYAARAYAIRALAAIADPRALDVLRSAAETDFAPSVRRAATKGVGALRWHQLPAEQQAIAQTQMLETLLKVLEDVDWSLRYAALVGLEALAMSAVNLRSQILSRLQGLSDTDLAVQARVAWAIANLQAAAPGADVSTSLPA